MGAVRIPATCKGEVGIHVRCWQGNPRALLAPTYQLVFLQRPKSQGFCPRKTQVVYCWLACQLHLGHVSCHRGDSVECCIRKGGNGSSAGWWCFHGQVRVVDRLCFLFFRSLKSSRNRKRAAYHALKSGVNKNTSKINHWTGNQRLHIISSFYGLKYPFMIHTVSFACGFGDHLRTYVVEVQWIERISMNQGEQISGFFLDYQASQKSNVFVSEAAHRRLGAGPSRPQKNNNFSSLFHCATWVKRHILHSTCLGIPTSTLYGLRLACGVRVRRLPNIHKRCRTAYGERMWRNFRVTEFKKCRVK